MLLLFAAALVVQVVCWAWLGAGFKRAKEDEPEPSASPLPLSVVVAARNEEANLPALLAALAAQTHPDFEVIVVDDASEDGTAALVEARAEQDARFRLVRVTEPLAPRKKHALTQGIAAAHHNRLAFTDADCTPPPGWLTGLAAHAEAEPDAVLVGYGPYRKEAGLLNAFVRYETLVTALLTAAAFAFAISMGEFGASLLLVRPEYATLPVAIYDRLGRPGAVNYGQALALSAVLMLLTALVMLILQRRGRSEF